MRQFSLTVEGNNMTTVRRVRVQVTGVVQGVGFRPFVYRLAHNLCLSGFVGNDGDGVFIEAEGESHTLDTLLMRLQTDAPPLAHITAVTCADIPPQHAHGFTIVASEPTVSANTLVSPDLATCADCLREFHDPADRRYRYPFINCTNCGPRFTITQTLPYDRPSTTMAPFAMCAACQAEYDDPTDRRFHAQPNACPDCGPQVQFVRGDESEGYGEDALQRTLAALAAGEIVAVKGVGGFHLACDATNPDAVACLRERKGRPHKPLAVMAADVNAVRALALVDDAEADLLTSRQRPVVLLGRRDDGPLADEVAPGLHTVGVMLPYTPLHTLLVEQGPLVMTSANPSGQPIITVNEAALATLREIADAFLLHDRDIHIPCDDSVVRAAYPVRRSRGYAPFPVGLPFPVTSLLAVGGELKATGCVARGRQAFMSQHIGDMQNLETLAAFEQAAGHLCDLFRVQPEVIVCDRHSGYLSTRWADRYAREHSLPLVKVGHHHAHLAAVMAEHGLPADAQVVGFIFDGTGYGDDGTIWGGEVLVGGYQSVERAAHLSPMPLPGGDAAVRHPYRLALAYLWASDEPWQPGLPPVVACSPVQARVLRQQLERNLNVAQTSSMGRLFDVVAALLGVCQDVTYEGQAAILLEAVCDPHTTDGYPPTWATGDLLQSVLLDMKAGTAVPVIAARFHNTIARLIVTTAERLRDDTGLETVALSGGVFQNVRLLRATKDELTAAGFCVLTHQRVPPNDGGLALGQAVVAHFQHLNLKSLR